MRLAFSGLLSWLENHSTVITPSRFLASVGYRQFSQDRLARAQSSWQRPEIVSLGGWLTAEWQKARFAHSGVPALLSPAQEHVLWRRIIAEEQLALFDADSAASMASRANRLLAEWQISKQDDAWNDRGDAAQFQRWSHRLEQICRREGWIARSDLWTLLPKWQNPSAPGIFLLSEPPAPALKRILEAFRHTAYQNHDRQKAACPGTQFEDFEEELDFAARWARARFESHPSSSIAVFVPDLARNHQLVERTFRHIFYPALPRLLLGGVAAAHSAFSLHAPWPLASEPLIAAALLLLQVARPEIPMADATAILRCRWIKGYSNERNQRALADLDLRRRRDLDVTFNDLESASSRCPEFSGIWRSVRPRLAALQPLDNYAGWARFCADLLQALGWPGDAELDTAETDLADAWLTTLSQLSSLSFVSGPVSLDTALADLRRLLETGHESQNLSSPVQILDAREASGLRFDVAIVTGLSEQTWPPLENRSPFIPFKLQRQRELPGSSPQLLRSRRAALTRSLFIVAPEIHATWSGRLAAIVGEFVSQNRESQPIWKGKSTWQAFKPAILEELDDSLAPPFVPSTTTRGGTGVIKAQSLCPFRAFAEYRLHSRSPEEGCLGLDSRERGGNLHQVLEFVWQNLRTRDRLASTDPRALEQLVEEAAAAVVRNQRASSFGKIVSAVEEQRLKDVVLEWLAIEKQRKQPFTVETVEEERYFELGGLRLRLRLDRIDRLPNGQLLLIDYKSGEQKRKKLEGERPEEPQLLVYAAGIGNQVDGILFAQLKSRDVRAVGFTRDKHFVSRTVDVEGSRWEHFLDEGIAKVEQLATEFKSGRAAVAPLPHACEFCAQKPLCRIREQLAIGEETEE